MKLLNILDGTPIPVTYRIAFIANFAREPLLRRIEHEFNITRPEWTVLICLSYQDGVSSRDICEITEQPSNTVSRGVAALERKGHIARAADSKDGRRTLLHLTKTGQETHDEIMALFVMAENSILSEFTETEIETLTRLLDKLARDVTRWSTLPPYQNA